MSSGSGDAELALRPETHFLIGGIDLYLFNLLVESLLSCMACYLHSLTLVISPAQINNLGLYIPLEASVDEPTAYGLNSQQHSWLHSCLLLPGMSAPWRAACLSRYCCHTRTQSTRDTASCFAGTMFPRIMLSYTNNNNKTRIFLEMTVRLSPWVAPRCRGQLTC